MDLIYLFAAVVLLASGLAAISIWSPRRLALKVSAIAIAGLLSASAYASYAELLSKPKPVSLEWAQRNASQATVLAATYEENKAIFLWLAIEGVDGPRAYVLPWSQNSAEQLQKAMREAEANGTGVQMDAPFQVQQQDSGHVFYAAPQPARPEKTAEAEGPLVYSPPDML
jgi:hypothetical protein